MTFDPDWTLDERLRRNRSIASSIGLSPRENRPLSRSMKLVSGNMRSSPTVVMVVRIVSALSMIWISDSTDFSPSMDNTAGPLSVTF